MKWPKWENMTPFSGISGKKDPGLSTTPRTDEERSKILEFHILDGIRDGWQIQHQSTHSAAFTRGSRPNHILHLLLSLVTFGLWLPIWFILGMSRRPQTYTIEVDQFGNTTFR